MKSFFITCKSISLIAVAVASVSASAVSFAEKPAAPVAKSAAMVENSPHKMVEKATDRVVAVVKQKGEALKQEPEKHFGQFSQMLDSLVDFPFIAKHVMGKKAYLSASEGQRDEFSEAFKRDLIKTYTGALATYSDRAFKVVPAEKPIGDALRTTVVQEISGPEGKLNVAYTMSRKNLSSPWKMINFTLPGQGVNLGATSRKQFAQAMVSNKGNLDAVISNWGS